jgi:hypothetical protein
VIAIVASDLDPQARALVRSWRAAGAALLSADDLGSPGWTFRPAEPERGTAVVNGRRIRIRDLRAVLTRRPAIVAEELSRIASADRAYVAAETNAFLVAWLHALPCPVINRPTTTSLCGPAWGDLHWRAAAARIGAAWAAGDDAEPARELVVCGERCFFADTHGQSAIAFALARAANADLLAVRMRGERICAASIAPDLRDPDVRRCLLSLLRRRA